MTNFEIAKAWLKAFNEHNLENLLALYDENAEHFSPKLKMRRPETHGLITGKEAMQEWWRDAFERLSSLSYKEVTITANDDRVFMEYLRIVDGESNYMVAEVLEIAKGKIIKSRVYHG